MKTKVTVVDYGLGNLHSVIKALNHCGAEVFVAIEGTQLRGADKIILPGVGAFSDGMAGLRKVGHDIALKEAAENGTPILGICLGAQLLLTDSQEFGYHQGLGIISGHVVKIPSKGIKVPHVGWKQLETSHISLWKKSPLASTPLNTWTYFVHSYHMIPENPQNLLATVSSGIHGITAVLQRDNITGMQFHPEKSGQDGLTMLRTFLNN